MTSSQTIDKTSQQKQPIPAITGKIGSTKSIKLFPDILQQWRPTLLAYASLSISTGLGFPIDSIKTRMQTHVGYKGITDCIKSTYRLEGISGFFKGALVPTMAISLTRSLTVSLFIAIKPQCYKFLYNTGKENHFSPLVSNVPVSLISGAASASLISLLACPFDLIKVSSQIFRLTERSAFSESLPSCSLVYNGRLKDFSNRDIASLTFKERGLRGLYCGFGYHLLRDSLSASLYYSSYELIKFMINKILNSNYEENSHASILIAGGLAGTIGGSVAFPIDTAKSLTQKNMIRSIICKEYRVETSSPKKAALHIFRKRSYKGLSATIVRTFFVNSLFFSIFEYSMAHIN